MNFSISLLLDIERLVKADKMENRSRKIAKIISLSNYTSTHFPFSIFDLIGISNFHESDRINALIFSINQIHLRDKF